MSLSRSMPEFLPDRLEAGTHNVMGIAGLLAAVRYIREHTCRELCKREQALMDRFSRHLRDMGGHRQFRHGNPALQSAVLSVIPEGMDCERFAEELGRRGVAVRTGLHCAPMAHATAGTLETGTVRFSFSPFNTAEQIDAAADICETILKKTEKP